MPRVPSFCVVSLILTLMDADFLTGPTAPGGTSSQSESRFAPAFSDRALWGYIDKTGKMVIHPQFAHAGAFSDGLANVMDEDGTWKYMDRTGETAIGGETFERAEAFSEGLAAVRLDGRYGYIDKSGLLVNGKKGIDREFHEAGRFSEGVAAVRVERQRSYIDRGGRSIVTPTVHATGPFSDGLAHAQLDVDSWGYINKSGVVVIRIEAVDVSDFSEGLAPVLVGGPTQPRQRR